MIYKAGVSPRLVLVLIACLDLCIETTFGQVPTTAVPFLLINTSPESNGQGSASVSMPSDDPYAVNFNPAHLGISSVQTNVMFSFYPTKMNWLPGLGLSDVTLNTKVLAGGINLERYTNLPLSIGIAYSRVNLNLGTFNRTSSSPDVIGIYEGEEHADAISIGVGVDYGIQVALGITLRRIESNLASSAMEQESGSGSSSAWSRDYGLLLSIPITELFAENREIVPRIAPIFNISFGSALTNVGGKMTYIDKAQSDPLPRNISIGTSLEIGFKYAWTNHKLLSFIWSRQSDNLLVGKDGPVSFYRGGFGDIDFFKNIVKGERTETIDLSQGWQIGLAEILYFRGGTYTGIGNRSFKTEGIGIKISGFFKLLKDFEIVEFSELLFIADHFDIQYDQSEYFTSENQHPIDNTKFSSLSFVVKF